MIFSTPKPAPQSKHRFRIRIAGLMADHWSGRFEGVETIQSPEGDTLVTGEVADQAAFFGILRTVEALGAPLVSIFAYPADGGRA
jgi:hypothetical protein